MDAATPDDVLRVMAEDAFEVLNWARREGMKKGQQLDQVVAAYRKTLSDTRARIVPATTRQSEQVT